MNNNKIYYFSKSEYSDKIDLDKIGIRGKRAIELSQLKMPIVPGLIISSEIASKLKDIDIKKDVELFLKKVESEIGKKFNDPVNPAMFKIVISPSLEMVDYPKTHAVGLCDKTIDGFIKNVGENFAYQDYAKFLIKDTIKILIKSAKKDEINNLTKFLDEVVKAGNLKDYKKIIEKAKTILPSNFFIDPYFQIDFLLKKFSLFLNSEEMDDQDSAIIIQPIVYGNYGEDSYVGNFFTRNIVSGKKELHGIFCKNKFDVEIGKEDDCIDKIDKKFKQILEKIADEIECHFKEIREIRFIIEKGNVWIIEQSSVMNASSCAQLKCLLYLFEKKVIDDKHVIKKFTPTQVSELLHPIVDTSSDKKFKSFYNGIAGAPGAAKGRIYFNTDRLLKAYKLSTAMNQDINFILCLPATYAEDVKAIELSTGVLSTEGGYSAHASVVARQYGKTSLVNPDLKIDTENKCFNIKDIVVREGDYITLDVPYYGDPRIILGNVDLIKPDLKESGLFDLLQIINTYIEDFKVLGNADTPKDAESVKMLGGEGIGLCRTEHMFFDAKRIDIFREMIVSSSLEEREKALKKIKEFQVKDFYELFKIMNPYPVTIRLLDPPLHEFLPHSVDEMSNFVNYLKSNDPKIDKSDIQYRCNSLSEVNPMLGQRGCRLAVTHPEIYHMQIQAIFEAAYKLKSEKVNTDLEIMIPIVMNLEELKFIKHGKKIEGKLIKGIVQIEKDIREKFKVNEPIDYSVGVMIELPAAALLADEIAKYADFFSFGTNDLTQTTHGLSRDDFNVFLPDYSKYDLINGNPFQILTEPVKEIIKLALARGRLTRPDLKIGLCGEHGGDPKNLEFLKTIGLNYVSCSSYSIPLAKLMIAKLEINKLESK